MKNNIIIGALILSVGVNLYQFVENKSDDIQAYKQNQANGYRRMSDGTMMGNINNASNMSDMMRDMSAGLQGKTGDAFDQEFLAEMIVHHQGAVDMAKQVLSTSKRPELLKLAKDIINAQTGEIQMMQTWQKNWFN